MSHVSGAGAAVSWLADPDHRGHPRRHLAGRHRAHDPSLLVPALQDHRRADRARCPARLDDRAARLVLSAWLHYLLGTTLAQIIDVFNFHLQFKLSSGGLIQMWRRLREILLAWYLEIQTQALEGAVLHADETGWRVNGATYWLWCFARRTSPTT